MSFKTGRTPRSKLLAYPQIPSLVMGERSASWHPGSDIERDAGPHSSWLIRHSKDPHQHEDFNQHQKGSLGCCSETKLMLEWVCVYTSMYTPNPHVQTHTNIYVYKIHAHVWTYMNSYTYTYINTNTYACMHTQTLYKIQAHVWAYINTHVYTNLCSCMHAHKHTCIRGLFLFFTLSLPSLSHLISFNSWFQ